MYNPKPFTADLQALQEKYGQPRQLIRSELGAILNPPTPLMHLLWSSQALVGMLKMLEGQNGHKLRCESCDSFVEYCLSILQTGTDQKYTFTDVAVWLQIKSLAKRFSNRAAAPFPRDSF